VNKLRWRCRRGVRELDILLLDYLEHVYPQSDANSQQAFADLLELDNAELLKKAAELNVIQSITPTDIG